jgi:hypothetical protein
VFYCISRLFHSHASSQSEGVLSHDGASWTATVHWGDGTTGAVMVAACEMDWANGEVWLKVASESNDELYAVQQNVDSF